MRQNAAIRRPCGRRQSVPLKKRTVKSRSTFLRGTHVVVEGTERSRLPRGPTGSDSNLRGVTTPSGQAVGRPRAKPQLSLTGDRVPRQPPHKETYKRCRGRRLEKGKAGFDTRTNADSIRRTATDMRRQADSRAASTHASMPPPQASVSLGPAPSPLRGARLRMPPLPIFGCAVRLRAATE
jgi:hypothetical protein